MFVIVILVFLAAYLVYRYIPKVDIDKLERRGRVYLYKRRKRRARKRGNNKPPDTTSN